MPTPFIYRTGFSRLDTDDHTSEESSRCNIIFVHGLRGHPRGTWGHHPDDDASSTVDSNDSNDRPPQASSSRPSFERFFRRKKGNNSKEGQNKPGEESQRQPFWPYELLRGDIPNARIWTYGYNADLIKGLFGANNQNSVSQHGRDLAIKLQREITNGPIIFVAHSLGGIVVKDAIHRQENLQKQTRGIVFLGTPHRGSTYAEWAQIASNIAAVAFQSSNKTITRSLEVDSEVLENIHEQFIKIAAKQKMLLHSFQEARGMTGVKGFNGKVVSDFSSILGLPDERVETLDADHRQMVKCTGKQDTRYRAISGVLKDLFHSCTEAGPTGLSTDLVLRTGPSPRNEEANSEPSIQGHLHSNLGSSGRTGQETEVLSHLEDLKQPDPSQRNRCLQSLAFTRMDDRALNVDHAFEGTCLWLLQHEEYTAWAESACGLLWIKGKPGSGKSTLLKHALQNHRSMPSTQEDDLIFSFFFHGRGDKLQQSPLGLFRSLNHQIMSQVPDSILDVVYEFQRKCDQMGEQGKKWEWHEEELWSHFKAALSKLLNTNAVWLFVDALDECGEKNARRLIEKFQTLFSSLQLPSTKGFHICFSCRPYPIQNWGSWPEISPEQHNNTDISTFVNSKLGTLHGHGIPILVSERASGVFLWAFLVVSKVQSLMLTGAGPKQIKEAIDSVPRELDKLYSKLVKSMGLDSFKLIRWVMFAQRPLTIVEMTWAMTIDPESSYRSLQDYRMEDVPDREQMKKRVQNLSRGLAEIILTKNGEHVVQFVHQSVKDFFIDKGLLLLDTDSESVKIAVGKAHLKLAKTCISYFAMDDLSKFTRSAGRKRVHSTRLLRQYPFLLYSIRSWSFHAKESDMDGVPQVQLLEHFIWPSNKVVDQLIDLCEVSPGSQETRNVRRETNLIHLIARHNLTKLLSLALQRTTATAIELNSRNVDGTTPLMEAVKAGHASAVDLLLTTGKIDVRLRDTTGYSALHWAASGGFAAVVELLLATPQVDVNAKNRPGFTALHFAALGGHDGIVKLLLTIDRLDVDERKQDGRTALFVASCGGHSTVVELLLTSGRAHPDARDEDGHTPLILAAAYDHVSVVQLLLATGQVDINARDKFGRTALFLAAKNNCYAMVNLLLTKGHADPSVTDNEGQTPLWWAAGLGHHKVVELLRSTNLVNIT